MVRLKGAGQVKNLAADLEVAWSFFIHAPALKPRGRAKPSLREQLFCEQLTAAICDRGCALGNIFFNGFCWTEL